MGTSLNGLTPKNTYKGLLKAGDNAALNTDLKTITDGDGNDTPLKLSTDAVGVGAILDIETEINGKQDNLTLTTTGTSGAATLIGDVLNIPQYSGGAGGATWGGITGTLSDQADLQSALNAKASTTNLNNHTNNLNNPHQVTKAQVGLGNADNTADADKPISSATQTALNAKQNSLGFTPENVANKGANNGYASLDSTGKVPSTQLPSYVDDVIEVANFASLPVTGETGKIYVTLDTNFVYRWSGSVYVKIAQPNAEWGSITGTLSNQTDLQNALNAKQNSLGFTPENVSNKSTTLDADKTSDTKYPSVKAVYDWAVGLFATIANLALKTDKLVVTNRQTASYTLVLSDADKLVEMNVGSANNLTIPLNSSVAFSTGTQILVAQYGAGQTTIVATSGVTVRSNGGKLKLNVQYSGATLIKIATDEWYLFGDIVA